MKKIIIANWKMNNSLDKAESWIENILPKIVQKKSNNFPNIILCPPSTMLDYIDGLLMERELEEIESINDKNIEDFKEDELEKLINQTRVINLGGQDCSFNKNGAFTGDVSAEMIKDTGAKYVILGHSERRSGNSENDEVIAKKVNAAIDAGLIPILCVGENKDLREGGEYKNFIITQLNNSIPNDLVIENLIIAYEPIWSIGSGLVPSIKEIEEVAELINAEMAKNKNIVNFHILYGGSIKKTNSTQIKVAKNINGLLVGGASLDEEEFYEIIFN